MRLFLLFYLLLKTGMYPGGHRTRTENKSVVAGVQSLCPRSLYTIIYYYAPHNVNEQRQDRRIEHNLLLGC